MKSYVIVVRKFVESEMDGGGTSCQAQVFCEDNGRAVRPSYETVRGETPETIDLTKGRAFAAALYGFAKRVGATVDEHEPGVFELRRMLGRSGKSKTFAVRFEALP